MHDLRWEDRERDLKEISHEDCEDVDLTLDNPDVSGLVNRGIDEVVTLINGQFCHTIN